MMAQGPPPKHGNSTSVSCVLKTMIIGDIDYMFIMCQARTSRAASNLNAHNEPTHCKLVLSPLNK